MDTLFLLMWMIPGPATNTMNDLSVAEAAEEKFKEVVKSYEAIKLERKNGVN